ncbi:YicC/YloC family endoribonuclease, partial [Staphylococcus aureus]
MTGYANCQAQPPKDEDGVSTAQASVSVELRSVNGRFLDLSMRMPEELRGLEPQLRELISAR